MAPREQYEQETGEKAMYRKDSSDYHTLKYVRWLEERAALSARAPLLAHEYPELLAATDDPVECAKLLQEFVGTLSARPDGETLCCICKKRRGVHKSTADNWYCSICIDTLPAAASPTARYAGALEVIAEYCGGSKPVVSLEHFETWCKKQQRLAGGL